MRKLVTRFMLFEFTFWWAISDINTWLAYLYRGDSFDTLALILREGLFVAFLLIIAWWNLTRFFGGLIAKINVGDIKEADRLFKRYHDEHEEVEEWTD